MTCLQDISQTRVLSSNNLLPTPLMLTSGQLAGSEEAEAYEAVYVRLMNVMPTQSKSNRNKQMVTVAAAPASTERPVQYKASCWFHTQPICFNNRCGGLQLQRIRPGPHLRTGHDYQPAKVHPEP
jgi:hypothetical protein